MDEAARAIDAGYAQRMMLEMAPDLSFGVLIPAFKGNEEDFAHQRHAPNGCTFLAPNLYCELHGTDLQPLECRFCHPSRKNRGPACHAAIENDWRSPLACSLVVGWTKIIGPWEKKFVWRRFELSPTRSSSASTLDFLGLLWHNPSSIKAMMETSTPVRDLPATPCESQNGILVKDGAYPPAENPSGAAS